MFKNLIQAYYNILKKLKNTSLIRTSITEIDDEIYTYLV